MHKTMLKAYTSWTLHVIGVLLLSAVASVPATGQQQGRCAYCVWQAGCGSGLGGYFCQNGGASTMCNRSNPQSGCYQDCSDSMFCNPHGSASACVATPPTAKEVRLQQQQENASPQTKPIDDEIQADLIKNGNAGVGLEPQLRGPVTLIAARHGSADLLKSATVLNLSEKVVLAIRVGWTVKTPNQPDEAHMGNWMAFASGLQTDGTGEIPAQNIDASPLRLPGTLVRVYVAQVRFQDGSIWERVHAGADPVGNQTSSLSQP